MQIDRIWEFVQRLSPLTRSCLLAELERLELCGVDMPGSADIQAKGFSAEVMLARALGGGFRDPTAPQSTP